LGVQFVRAKYYKCFPDYAKRSFRLSVDSIIGKIDRIASEESVLLTH